MANSVAIHCPYANYPPEMTRTGLSLDPCHGGPIWSLNSSIHYSDAYAMNANDTLHRRLRKTAGNVAAALALGSAGLIAATPAHAAPAGCEGDTSGKSWVFLEANGIRNSNGWLTVKIYNNSDDFLGSGGSMDVIRVPARPGNQRVCMKLPANGNYAFFVYHDEDKDKKLNFNFLKMSPTEGGGFSNNPDMGRIHRPSWGETAIKISRPGLATRVNVKYP